MKILNTPLTQKSPGIRTKRPEKEPNLQTKQGAISGPWRMNTDGRDRNQITYIAVYKHTHTYTYSGTYTHYTCTYI